MEQRQGDRQLCRYLFSKSLEALPRGRFTYLSWATFEQQDGQLDDAQRLLERGHSRWEEGRECLPNGGLVELLAGVARGRPCSSPFRGPAHLQVWKHDSLLAGPVAQALGASTGLGEAL